MKWQKFPFKLEKQFRLPGWDYSNNGYYFVTICTQDRQNFFGNILCNEMIFSEIGKICLNCWLQIPDHFNNLFLNKFTIMPNHLHGILVLKNHSVMENYSDPITGTHHGSNVGTHHGSNVGTHHGSNVGTHHGSNVGTHHGSNVGTHHDAFLQTKNQIQNKFTYLATKSTQSISLSIKLFKSSVKRICNQKNLNFQWQPRFHDRIIRNEKEYFAIKQYIEDNPKNWLKDKNFRLS